MPNTDKENLTVCATPYLQSHPEATLEVREPPRPNTADQACDDLIEFLVIRNREVAAAQAYEDFLKSGLPIFTSEIDREATMIAGKFRAV